MNMMSPVFVQSELLRQADIVQDLGSPFVANVLRAAHRQLYRAPQTHDLITHWQGDPAAAALAMRLNGALHAIARQGNLGRLSSLFRHEHSDFDGAIGEALAQEDGFIAQWMQHPTQTNEVARAAALMGALMVVHQRFGWPVALLELGSSCGLNLNLGHYSYDLGGVQAGVPGSPVRLSPLWHGGPPPAAQVEIASTRGVDLRPLNALDPAMRARLLAFVWADKPARTQRLKAALTVAERLPPSVDRGHAAPWLRDRLAEPQPDGLCRVVMNSMVMQYIAPDERSALMAVLTQAGAQASAQRPLAWISFEWTPCRSQVHLRLTCWPDGTSQHLATCHPYGEWVQWLA